MAYMERVLFEAKHGRADQPSTRGPAALRAVMFGLAQSVGARIKRIRAK